ncbi:MAG TPA: amidohydrolase, partial [Thermoanaerobaculia bacterium]
MNARTLSILALLLPLPAAAEPDALAAAVAAHAPEIVELRHRIHQHPELGNRELETAKLVAEHLRALGL